ncbi:hypothetical protein MCEMSEM29_01270 [Methylophilaceae bacterium]
MPVILIYIFSGDSRIETANIFTNQGLIPTSSIVNVFN